jgi:hypothetical protein
MTEDFYTNDYLRRLLIEAPYIKARLLNPGGSVILTGTAADTESPQEYSSQIGSGFHLDEIEMEVKFRELPQDQQEALVAWALGVTPKEASMYFAAKGTVLRKRRERGVTALTEKMNDGEQSTEDTGRTSGRPTPKAGDRYRRVV